MISFVMAQLGASLLGCAVGIPLGIMLGDAIIRGNTKRRGWPECRWHPP